MKIGMLIPSRERLNLKLTLISSIITSVDDINNVNLYFGIDDDDPTRETAMKICEAIPFVHFVPIHNDGKFIGLGKMWNELARNCDDEIFGYLGDDMIFKTPGWDTQILEEFNSDNLPEDKIKAVHCYDGQRPNGELAVNAFIHRKYMDVVGYFIREEFLINWSDQWLHQMFSSFDRLKYRKDIHIHHNHWVFGGREKDDVATRMLSDNHDKDSDAMWFKLSQERIDEAVKLSNYLGFEPNWDLIDTRK
jgi:hypothetical protein